MNIQDLERANHRLAVETTTDKKHIKTLKTNIENLELKCEHLQGTIEELNLELALARRRSAKTSTPARDNASPGDGGGNFSQEVSSSLDETRACNSKVRGMSGQICVVAAAHFCFELALFTPQRSLLVSVNVSEFKLNRWDQF